MAPPIEPPPTGWGFPEPERWDPTDDLVAIGADLEPGTVLAAYRRGLFPMPFDQDGPFGWWSPVTRGVLEPGDLVVSRSLRRARRNFEIRVDSAFAGVIDACADPRREGAWIDGRIREGYLELHRLGWAHSVETWQDGRLVGGLYGLAIGGLFAGESMFHHVTDASKVALVALVDLVADDGVDRLIDVQWVTDHLATLGVTGIDRSDYLHRLPELFTRPAPRFALRRSDSHE